MPDDALVSKTESTLQQLIAHQMKTRQIWRQVLDAQQVQQLEIDALRKRMNLQMYTIMFLGVAFLLLAVAVAK